MSVRGQLPSAARSKSTRFRWLQTTNSGINADVWSIDDVYIGGGTGNNYLLEMFEKTTQALHASAQWVSIGAAITASNICSHLSRVLLENSTSVTPVQAGTVAIGATGSYVLQFDMVMKCGQTYSNLNPVKVEYNKVAGGSSSWTSVRSMCYPGSSTCDNNKDLYARSSRFYSSEFKKWRRVVLPLPSQLL